MLKGFQTYIFRLWIAVEAKLELFLRKSFLDAHRPDIPNEDGSIPSHFPNRAVPQVVYKVQVSS